MVYLNVFIKASDVLLLSKAVRDLLDAESIRVGGQFLDLDQRAGELAILHGYRVVSDPGGKRRGQFAVFAVFPLCFLQYDDNRNNITSIIVP